MSQDRAFFPVVKINPTYSVSYFQSTNPNFHSGLKPPSLNKHDGSISDKAATKIKNAINWMLLFSEKKTVYSKKEKKSFSFYLNFITLTLPSEQKHSDDFVKEKMLVPFLEWMKKTNGAKMFLWKAESQANGNIHFHITTHVFLHWKSVRKKWNVILAKHGYCKTFQDGTNDKGNAATQIKAAKNARQIGYYLATYIGKKDKVKLKIKEPKGLPKFYIDKNCHSEYVENFGEFSVLKRKIEGRLWACSNNIANIQCFADPWNYLEDEVYDIFEDVLSITDNLKKEKYFTVAMYDHLKFVDMPSYIKQIISEKKATVNISEKKKYIVESLFE